MKILWMAGLLAVCSALAVAVTHSNKPAVWESQTAPPKLQLHNTRTSPTDLELDGDLPGASGYAGRYVAYSDLQKLSQVSFTVTDDPNFSKKVEIRGIYLDELMRALNIPEKNTLVAAVCDDGYEAHYPVEYWTVHHPILVLTVNGKQLALTSRTADGGAYGPYLVSHPSFVSRYRILAHPEEAQIPNGVLELRFLREDDVLHAIAPPGDFAAGSPQMQGYVIAQEDCFRCHNSGAYGGSKAGISWTVLARIARSKPDYFKAYIRDPQDESEYAEMPGSPEYDDATLGALTAYFQVIPTNIGQK